MQDERPPLYAILSILCIPVKKHCSYRDSLRDWEFCCAKQYFRGRKAAILGKKEPAVFSCLSGPLTQLAVLLAAIKLAPKSKMSTRGNANFLRGSIEARSTIAKPSC